MTKSETEHEVWVEESLFDLGGHYKTTISDDGGKVEGRGITSEKAQEIASDKWRSGGGSSNSGGSSDSSSDSGSICYLTTACVKAMGLPNNCLELKTLRDFRDKILMHNPSSRKAVKEYYQIAPEIVCAIEEQNNAQKIWQAIYMDIKYAKSLILISNFKRAFENYQRMTLGLKEKYLD